PAVHAGRADRVIERAVGARIAAHDGGPAVVIGVEGRRFRGTLGLHQHHDATPSRGRFDWAASTTYTDEVGREHSGPCARIRRPLECSPRMVGPQPHRILRLALRGMLASDGGALAQDCHEPASLPRPRPRVYTRPTMITALTRRVSHLPQLALVGPAAALI